MREVLSDCALLEHGLSPDLHEFELDELVVRRQPAKASQRLASFGLAVVVNEPPRRERHEQHANAEDDRRSQLQAQWDQPRGLGLGLTNASNVVGTIVDPVRDHNSRGDSKLLETDKRATDFWWCTFGIVHRDNHGQAANAHTGDESTTQDRARTCRGSASCLDNHTEHEDRSVDEDSVFAGKNLSQETRVHCAKPRAQLEDRCQPSSLGRVLVVIAHVVLEVGHGKDTREDTLVVAIEQTAQAGKAGNTKDLRVPHEGHGSCGTLQSHTGLQSAIVEL